MFRKVGLVVVSVVLWAAWLSTAAYAGLKLEKDLPMSQVTSVPSSIIFKVFESEVAATPVTSQTFPSGKWEVDYDFSKYPPGAAMARVRVDFTNTAPLTRNMDLWMEMWWNGAVRGPREKLKDIAWALFAKESLFAVNADTLDGIHAAGFVQKGEANSVSAGMIADGAVTGDKIAAGTITIANADRSIMAGSPHTLVVAKSGGDYNSIQAAMNAIGSSATADQPYLVKVMPGTYLEQVTLKSNVHIQGSGIGITTVKFGGGAFTVVASSVNNARLSQLTVVNTSIASDRGAAIYALNCKDNYPNLHPSLAIDEVEGICSADRPTGYSYGIYNEYAYPKISHCTFTARSISGKSEGILNKYSSPSIDSSRFLATSNSGNAIGIHNKYVSDCVINNSVFAGESGSGNGYGVYNYASPDTSFTNCNIDGKSNSGSGYGVYTDASKTQLDNSHVRGESDSDYAYGVYGETSSSIKMVNCSLEGSSSGTLNVICIGGPCPGISYGVYGDASTIKLMDCKLIGNDDSGSGSGAYYNDCEGRLDSCLLRGATYGVYLNSSDVSIRSCQIEGSHTGGHFGGGSAQARDSDFEGSTYSIYVNSSSTPRFGSCELDGNYSQTTGKRVNCYDGDFNPVPNL